MQVKTGKDFAVDKPPASYHTGCQMQTDKTASAFMGHHRLRVTEKGTQQIIGGGTLAKDAQAHARVVSATRKRCRPVRHFSGIHGCRRQRSQQYIQTERTELLLANKSM